MAQRVKNGLRADRRSFRRYPLRAPVVVTATRGAIPGTAENISYLGLLIRAADPVPEAGESCSLTLSLPGGDVRARGRVVRSDSSSGMFAVELVHLDSRGELLLATTLLS